MFGLGGSEIVVIVLVALLVFGPHRIPEIAKSVKRGFDEWRKVRNQVDNTITELRQEIDLKLETQDSPRIEGTRASSRKPAEAQANAEPRCESSDAKLAVPMDDDYLASARAQPATEQSKQEPASKVDPEEDYLRGGDV